MAASCSRVVTRTLSHTQGEREREHRQTWRLTFDPRVQPVVCPHRGWDSYQEQNLQHSSKSHYGSFTGNHSQDLSLTSSSGFL